MILYTIKNLLPIKDLLKTLISSGYIKIRRDSVELKELGKMKKDKILLKQFLQCCIYRTLFLL